ncbi:MAG TPA: hypothetical protein VJ821_12875 [Anaerolineales bacterium]|nr:hypothetical protein [Anaerolineales bacterium]
MFYQNPDSDITFLIAIAIIAGILIVFMGVATFVLLRSENKKDTQAAPKDERKPIPPVEISAASRPKERPKIDSSPIPPAEIAIASPPKERQEDVLPPISPVEDVAASPSKERPESELQSSPRVIRSLWGIFLTTSLMFAVTLAIFYFINPYNILGALLLLIGLPFSTAVAGTVGVRLTHLEWRLTFVPVLLFLAGSALLTATSAYANYQFFLLLAAIGSVFVPLMNREGKEANLSLQAVNWFVCFIIASMLAFWGYLRLRGILGPPLPIPAFFYWFAIILAFISPACIAVAWLRITGTKWLPALLMIPSMPVGVFIISFLTAVTSD